MKKLIEHGRNVFIANWTVQEGAGRPLTKGTGAALADPGDPLVFPRNFNRISAPDANSCAGCHNAPFGLPGGGGDFVANVFVLGQRFDLVRFNPEPGLPTKETIQATLPVPGQVIPDDPEIEAAVDEHGNPKHWPPPRIGRAK